ncbi:MAG: NAD(P)-dependent oxidoreductase [Herbiconiux sp.]|uniref:NAD-dependent epimerase/dehydratase family protein n=1 Tax=Herbiconiux sp. TaxID=1871186 RepID=UPI001211589A|nr:NAD(P)-dependent oxidoreductase [Herbiconiux sp.]TAJ49088.1 MAG: NAD(P)-dependent oxidoreductase [Herbiconiux sp.]
MSQRHVLITGAGMVGTSTARELLADGWRVTLVDRSMPRAYVREVLGDEALDEGRVELIEVDLTDQDARAAALQDLPVDAVVHTAALIAARAQRDVLETLAVNVEVPLWLAGWAHSAGAARFVSISSWSVFSEDQPGPITEDSPLMTHFTSYYIASKLAAEHLLSAYAASSGLQIAAIRPTVVYGYGPNLGGGVGSAAIEAQVLRGVRGENIELPANIISTTELVYAGDVGRAVAAAVTVPMEAVFTWFTIGSQETTTIEELAATLRELFPAVEVAVGSGSESSVVPPRQSSPTDLTETLRTLGIPQPLRRREGFERFAGELRQAQALAEGGVR